MDLYTAIRELHDEKKRIDYAIAALEAKETKARVPAPYRRRGRKVMSHEERLEVSKRMRAYWAARRNGSNVSEEEIAADPELVSV